MTLQNRGTWESGVDTPFFLPSIFLRREKNEKYDDFSGDACCDPGIESKCDRKCVLQCVAVCCSGLQCVVVCCGVLYCVAVF